MDCGTRTSDWCEAISGDACGKHTDTQSCRQDPRCRGMSYRGESVVACIDDGSGFSTNCPTVGCMTKCDLLDEKSCEEYGQPPWNACQWKNNHCAKK